MATFEDHATGRRYNDIEIEEYRAQLQKETGLDLSNMSAKGVLINYLSRSAAQARRAAHELASNG